MAKKKRRKKHPSRPSKALKRQARLSKAKQWLPAYEGTKIVSAYRKHFCVDVNTAVRDLLELGYEFQPGYVDNLLKSEAARQEQARAQKEARRGLESYNPDQNGTFFYIAGYTSSTTRIGLRGTPSKPPAPASRWLSAGTGFRETGRFYSALARASYPTTVEIPRRLQSIWCAAPCL
ncbi:MAG: hypothetical protein LBB94_11835 [Clostridiales bacterium]|jgi:hypothetical protein|nr:hypothetical protein [Clostridiales bacterium]